MPPVRTRGEDARRVKPCADPSCRCHIRERNGEGWRLGAKDEAEHGTIYRYQRGCRCEDCRRAAREAQRRARANRLRFRGE